MPVEKSLVSETRPLKVLVSAFAFSPIKGSEFGVGWDYVRAVALRHKVWVITRSNEREETEQYLQHHRDALCNVSVHYVPLKNRTINIPLREIVYGLIYRNWQQRAYRLARALDAEVDFDLVHHLNGIDRSANSADGCGIVKLICRCWARLECQNHHLLGAPI
jgi:hypothetical protein